MEKEILKYWGFDNKVIVEEENIGYATDGEKHIWTVNKKRSKYINADAKDNTDFKILKKCIKEVKDDFPQLYKKLPRQAIHRDFQGENLIFKNNKLVGYIDFDLSQINARLFDVCYMLT